jgi:TRAP-type C4-dicarboxylate transport system permease small subunit
MIQALGRFLKGSLWLLDKLEYGVLAFLFAVMVGLAFLQIVLRIFFATGVLWGDPLLRHLLLWVALLGATMATKEGKHINIDVITRILPDKGKIVVHALTDLFSAAICIFLLEASLKFLRDESQAGSLAFLTVPIWTVCIIFPIAFGLIALRFAASGIRNGALAFKGRSR